MTAIKERPSLATLPSELIQNIIKYLSPIELTALGATCRRLHEHSLDDSLWKVLAQDSLPGGNLRTPPTGKTYREIFLAHHPYWFLTRYKIWFSDSPHHGKLLVARYSQKRQAIEAYTLAAKRSTPNLELWTHNPDVIIHSFDPRVQLNTDQLVVKIGAASPRNFPADHNRFQRELSMDINLGRDGAASIFSGFILARACPPVAITPQTQVWPPLKLPAIERTRNASAEGFRGPGHRPSNLSQITEAAFRIRKWMEFSSHGRNISMRIGEDVNTYATLPPSCYTPTKCKPWRGIWVGDYAGHGCEFLVVLQPDEPIELPSGVRDILRHRLRRLSLGSDGESDGSYQSAVSHLSAPNFEEQEFMENIASNEWMGYLSQHERDLVLQSFASASAPAESDFQKRSTHLNGAGNEDATDDEEKYQGQLLAIKLTGDPNVPRGEYTFIAPDLGPAGTVRIATESPFAGARVVRSCGHIASTGFVDGRYQLQFPDYYADDPLVQAATLGPYPFVPQISWNQLTMGADTYIPSQLILVSDDCLAQYWEAFGHVSFYKRVDIDSLLHVD